MNAIAAGTKVVIVKGCAARGVKKGAKITIREVQEMGAEYGHNVKVVLSMPGVGTGLPPFSIAFYARHVNRLSDDTINLNDGNPLHKIVVRRA